MRGAHLLDLCDGDDVADHEGCEEGEEELDRVLEEGHDNVVLTDSEVGQSCDDLA